VLDLAAFRFPDAMGNTCSDCHAPITYADSYNLMVSNIEAMFGFLLGEEEVEMEDEEEMLEQMEGQMEEEEEEEPTLP
jgi:hypothetical protein